MTARKKPQRTRAPASVQASTGIVHDDPRRESGALSVFVSYHSNTSDNCARRVMKAVKHKFPLASVFVSDDQNAVRLGADWKPQVAKKLHAANVFIAIIDEAWRYRVHVPNSTVRQEVEGALWNPNVRCCFSLRLSGVARPSGDDLPVTIKEVANKEFFKDCGDHRHLVKRQLRSLLGELESIETELLTANTLPVALVSSTLALRTRDGSTTDDSLAFFSLMVTEIVQEVERKKTLPMHVIVKIPEVKSIEAGELHQKELVQNVLREHARYRAVIVSPFSVKALAPVIRDFCTDHPRYPIFTVDQCFGEKPWREIPREDHNSRGRSKGDHGGNDTKWPPGVMCDWYAGGKLAANVLWNYLDQVRVNNPLIWVLTGIDGTEARQRGFRHWMRDNTNIHQDNIEDVPAKFQQDVARAEFRRKYDQDGRLPHAVFCTNDEMALGVAEALDEIDGTTGNRDTNNDPRQSPGPGPSFGIKVVGFDSIHDVTTHLSERSDRKKWHPRYLNTVDVRIRDQANSLVEMIVEYVFRPRSNVKKRIRCIEPRPFVPIRVQQARVQEEHDHWTRLWQSVATSALEDYQKPRPGKPCNARIKRPFHARKARGT